MGSFSIWHWLVVLVIVILIFGTKKLKTLGSDLGEAIKNFKSGMKDEGEKPAAEAAAPAAAAPARAEPAAEAKLLAAQAPETAPATPTPPRPRARAKAKSKARRAPKRKSAAPQ